MGRGGGGRIGGEEVVEKGSGGGGRKKVGNPSHFYHLLPFPFLGTTSLHQ